MILYIKNVSPFQRRSWSCTWQLVIGWKLGQVTGPAAVRMGAVALSECWPQVFQTLQCLSRVMDVWMSWMQWMSWMSRALQLFSSPFLKQLESMQASHSWPCRLQTRYGEEHAVVGAALHNLGVAQLVQSWFQFTMFNLSFYRLRNGPFIPI